MKMAMNNTARRIVMIVLTVMMVLGTGLFDYACYAVEECRAIDNSYPAETGQIMYADSVQR